MKKVAVVMLLVLALSGLASAKSDIGLKGVGGQLAYVFPEDPIESTIGFGGNVYLGKVSPQLKLFTYVDYWKKSYEESKHVSSSFSMLSIMAALRYQFPSTGNIKPYAGGGLGLNIGSASWEYEGEYSEYFDDEGSESETDLGILIMVGASTMLSPNMEGFAEVRYNIADLDFFGIYAGITYMLK
ncbi:MAG TPA: outer membrane beta-barrel protein [bacterium]|nr:outer membrane beta-barrel protein [bacterium]